MVHKKITVANLFLYRSIENQIRHSGGTSEHSFGPSGGKEFEQTVFTDASGAVGRGCWMLKLQIDQNKRTRTNENFMLTIAPFQLCMKAKLYVHRIRGFIYLCTCSQPTSRLHLPVYRATQCYGNLDSTWRLHHGEWLSAVCSSDTKWSDI